MTPSLKNQLGKEFGPIPLGEVERELARRLVGVQPSGNKPVLQAHLSNLVIFCHTEDLAGKILDEIPAIVKIHPARVILLIGERGSEAGEMSASIRVPQHCMGDGQILCSPIITLRAKGPAINRLPYAVRALVIGDLPINLWWAVPEPPPLGGDLLFDLGEHAQQIIYDSIGWTEPARGVVATASWLAQVEEGSDQCRWRVIADLNWRRLKNWRRILGQTLDPATAPGALKSISEILVSHGPHAVIQAWELVSWLATRLGWKVQTGKIQPGVEIGWQFATTATSAKVRLRRLDQGPSSIRNLRIACTLNDKPGALNLMEEPGRISVLPEGIAAAPRTMTVPREPLSEIVAKQLSEREKSKAFHESMNLARTLAQSVLG
jgi:glucose-6-phosphate dehydrogenase assembly protein OpcA